jgi:hypothetical protein
MSICSSSLSSSHGFHPKLVVNVTLPSLPNESCASHIFFTLPPLVFIDKFEFPFRHRVWGNPDLELPVHALESQDSTFVMIDLGHTAAGESLLEIPLHLRYGQARSGGGYETVQLEDPIFFTSCPGDGSESSLRKSSKIRMPEHYFAKRYTLQTAFSANSPYHFEHPSM